MPVIAEIKDVESADFAARVNIASDLPTFLRAIAEQPSVAELNRRVCETPSFLSVLFTKMRHLRDVDFDGQYENPKDVAMATYGWILATTNPELMGLVGDVLSSLRNSWWSSRLATLYQSRAIDETVAGPSLVPEREGHFVARVGMCWSAEHAHPKSPPLVWRTSAASLGVQGDASVTNREFRAHLGLFDDLDGFRVCVGGQLVDRSTSRCYPIKDLKAMGKGRPIRRSTMQPCADKKHVMNFAA